MTETTNSTLNNITPSATLWEMLADTAQQFPQNVAIQMWKNHSISSSYSYKDLLHQATDWGKKLQEIGLKPGDRVALLSENCLELVVAFFAVFYCGATAVLLEPRLEGKDFHSLIAKSDPQLLITTPKLLHKLPKESSLSIPILNLIGNLQPLNGSKTPALKPNLDGDPTIALMIFTSGTTGNFKGVLIEHSAVLHGTKGSVLYGLVTDLDHFLGMLPLTHILGIVMTITTPLAVGASITYIDKIQGETISLAMKETKTTIFPLVPRVIELFYNKICQNIGCFSPIVKFAVNQLVGISYRFRSATGWNIGKRLFFSIQKQFGGQMRYMVSGGAPLSPSIYRYMEGLGFTIIEGYGLTETTNAVFCNTVTDPNKKVGSVGKNFPGNRIRIDSQQKDQPGEILIQGPTVMKGYFRDLNATAEALKDGWFHTGDLGRVDKNGYLYITGRLKEVIVMPSGEKAMPQDVEERYSGITDIEEIAVFGVPIGSSSAEEIHAAVIVSESLKKENLSDELIHQRIKENILKKSDSIPPYLRIHEVHVIEAIPKTVTMKVRRAELKEMVKEKKKRAKSKLKKNLLSMPIKETAHDALAEQILAIVKQQIQLTKKTISKPLSLSTSFQLDLEFDSLTMLELISSVEKTFHISLIDGEDASANTIGDLIQSVRNAIYGKKEKIDPEITKYRKLQRELLSSPDNEIALPDRCCSSIGGAKSFAQRAAIKGFETAFNITSTGKENLFCEPQFILASNHCSHLDSISLISAAGMSVDDFAVLAAEDYFFKGKESPHFLLSWINLVPFKRQTDISALVENLKLCNRWKETERNFIIFPEGTRSLDGEIHPFKSFIGILALELNIPIIPTYLHGTYESLSKGKIIPSRRNIKAVFGEPIQIAPFIRNQNSLNDTELYQAITAETEARVRSLEEQFRKRH